MDLTKVKSLSFVDHCDGWIAVKNYNSGAWGGGQSAITVSTDGSVANHCARILTQSADSITVFFVHNFASYGGTLAAMVFELQPRDDGIYAKVLKSKAMGANENNPSAATAISKSYDELDQYSIYTDDDGNKRIGEFLIYDTGWTADTKPKTWKGDLYTIENGFMPGGAVGDYTNFSFVVDNPAQLTFSGNVLTAGDMTLVADVPVTFAGHLADTTSAGVSEATVANGVAYLKGAEFKALFAKNLTASAKGTTFAMKGQTLNGKIKTSASGTIDIAADAELFLTHADDSSWGKDHSATWRISGTVEVNEYRGFSQSVQDNKDAPYSEVLPGGKLILAWGTTSRMRGDQPIYVRDGGLVVATNSACTFQSSLDKTIIVEKGGVYSNAFVAANSDGRARADLCRPAMINLCGGRYEGVSFWAGYENYGRNADNALFASGTESSTMAARYFMIEDAADTGFAGGVIDVADVTGNDDSDLIVESSIQRRSNASSITDDLSRWGYGIIKTGAGTMELRGVSTFGKLSDGKFGGTTMLSNGTIRVAKSAAGSQLGHLHLGGDAALQLDEGATVDFAPSTDVSLYVKGNKSATFSLSWNPDATLTLKSKVAPKSIRFGTDASGLTADQLAQIKYARSVTTRKNVVFSLDKDGYLKDSLSGGLIIVIQ